MKLLRLIVGLRPTLARQMHLALVLVAALVLLGTAVIAGISHWVSLNSIHRLDAQSLAGVVAANLAAPVLFRDEQAADTILHTLSVRSDIDCAQVLDHFGHAVAHYRSDLPACHIRGVPSRTVWAELLSRHHFVVVPIVVNRERVGSLMLQSNLSRVAATLTNMVWVLAGALLAIALFAYPLTRGLARRISAPIRELMALTRQVADEGDYTVRADGHGPEEIQALNRSFNQMLDQIEVHKKALTRHQLDLEDTVAQRTAELRAKQEELERLARTDGLTGLYNRRHFMELAAQEYLRSQRHGHSMSILMIDLDHFKRVNDTYGHLVGDKVLVGVAALVQAEMRASDVAGRLGGEEFAVMLPETALDDACRLAERLRRAVQRWRLPREGVGEMRDEMPDGMPDGMPAVSCSIGVASWERGSSVTLEQLFKQADDALYLAKERGRNGVVAA